MLYVSAVPTSKTDPTRLDYLIAARIGNSRVLRPAMRIWRNTDADDSGACLQVGQGHGVDDALVRRAYAFYVAVWTAVGTTALVPFIGIGLTIKAIIGTRHADAVLKVIICVLVTPWVPITIMSMLLIALGMYRMNSAPTRTGKALKQTSARPAELSDDGEDFWVALGGGIVVAVLMNAVIALA